MSFLSSVIPHVVAVGNWGLLLILTRLPKVVEDVVSVSSDNDFTDEEGISAYTCSEVVGEDVFKVVRGTT
jgi:hypothetical protein